MLDLEQLEVVARTSLENTKTPPSPATTTTTAAAALTTTTTTAITNATTAAAADRPRNSLLSPQGRVLGNDDDDDGGWAYGGGGLVGFGGCGEVEGQRKIQLQDKYSPIRSLVASSAWRKCRVKVDVVVVLSLSWFRFTLLLGLFEFKFLQFNSLAPLTFCCCK